MTNSVSKRITAQMIFDAAWQAFIIEGKPPAQEQVNELQTDWACRYRTRDGRKCAIGLCIPDGHSYQTSNISLTGLIGEDWHAETPLFDEEFFRNDELRESIQGYLHDRNAKNGAWLYSPERLEEIYRNFAKDFKLTIPGEESNACSVE